VTWIIKCRCGEQVIVEPGIDVYIPMLEHVYTKHGFKPYIPRKSNHDRQKAIRYKMKLVKNFFVNDAVAIKE
jgi:hypothetical protein